MGEACRRSMFRLLGSSRSLLLFLLVGVNFLISKTLVHSFQYPLFTLRPDRRSWLLSNSRGDDLHYRIRTILQQSSTDDNDNKNENEGSSQPQPDPKEPFDPSKNNLEGETLLCMYLAPQMGVSDDDAFAIIQEYSQSFPFCAILPVQPLTYQTTPAGNVQVKFLRKKTAEKGSIDGGINFYIQQVKPDDDEEKSVEADGDGDDVDNDVEEEEAPLFPTHYQDKNRSLIQITAKRNTYGQTIAKIMAEKLIVTKFVAGIKGDPDILRLFSSTTLREALLDKVQCTSLYHKWMDIEFKKK